MPRTFDRRTPANDKDPLRDDLDYDSPGGVIDAGAQMAGGPIHNFFTAVGSLFGLPTPEEFVTGVAAGIGEVISGAVQFVNGLGGFFAGLVGGVINAIQIPVLDPTKILNLPGLFGNVEAGFKAIFNGWFGGTGAVGTPQEVAYTIEAIKDAVINGYTVTTFTSSTVNWAVPQCTEMIAILVGCGQNGGDGGSANVTGTPGGAAGTHGSYVVQQLDTTTLPAALDIAVGTGQARSYVRAHNATAHTGAVIAESPPPGNAGGIATSFGFTPTNSVPGAGGVGGKSGSDRAGTAGQSTVLALGGAAGSGGNFWGGNGSPGGNVSAGSSVKCGGGGGGGGQGSSASFNVGGSGGPGGYPGGGGGGGGAGIAAAAGAGGVGATGVVWLFYR